MEITEKIYNEAKEIVRIYELYQQKKEDIKKLPTLEKGMILEYRDLAGQWYEYTKELQENIYFEPLKLRVRVL